MSTPNEISMPTARWLEMIDEAVKNLKEAQDELETTTEAKRLADEKAAKTNEDYKVALNQAEILEKDLRSHLDQRPK